MPRFYISYVEIDGRNGPHLASRGLDEDDYRYMLSGRLEASPNKRRATGRYKARCIDPNGRRWDVIFDYDAEDGSARPITAIPA